MNLENLVNLVNLIKQKEKQTDVELQKSAISLFYYLAVLIYFDLLRFTQIYLD